MNTSTLDSARVALNALKAIAGKDTIDPHGLAMAALIVGEHVDNLLAHIADQQRDLLIAEGAIRSGQASLTTARRDAALDRRAANLMADALAMSERRPHRQRVESARVLGIVRGMATRMPWENAVAAPEPDATPTPSRPALITNPRPRRWSAAYERLGLRP